MKSNFSSTKQQAANAPHETDPLISTVSSTNQGRRQQEQTIRSRRSSKSPTISQYNNNHRSINNSPTTMQPQDAFLQLQQHEAPHEEARISQPYHVFDTDDNHNNYQDPSRRVASARSNISQGSASSQASRRSYVRRNRAATGAGGGDESQLEIPQEVYSVRKAALSVLKPLTKTWLIVSTGFSITVLLGMAKWTRLLVELPYWFILFPAWMAHVGLFLSHINSAKALSQFITQANEARQHSASRDASDRTEYLPLLQSSLKFGVKTGLLSFGALILEVLVYMKLIHGISLSVVLFPMWILVLGGIVHGLLCKSQHYLRVLCWILVCASMVMACLKVDSHSHAISWRMIVLPVVTVLCISSATLIYIVYGHQVGYYRLTESQLTAGNLYSLAALLSIVLVIVLGEVIPLSRPVELTTKLFVVVMAPVIVVLLGMGGYVISRDEFGRLLLYGGQSSVHPKVLKWTDLGWTSVQGQGITNIPMFGQVSFQPLDKKPEPAVEICMCCTCYPYQDEDEDETQEEQAFLVNESSNNAKGSDGLLSSSKKKGAYVAPAMKKNLSLSPGEAV